MVFEDNTACIEWSNHVMGGPPWARACQAHRHSEALRPRSRSERAHSAIKIPTEFPLADLLMTRKGLHHRQFERCLCSLLGEDPPLAELSKALGLRRGATTLGWISKFGVLSALRRGVQTCVGWKAAWTPTQDPESESVGSFGTGLTESR